MTIGWSRIDQNPDEVFRTKVENLMLSNTDDWMAARDIEARNRSTDLDFKLWLLPITTGEKPQTCLPSPKCKDSLSIGSLMATLNEVSAGLILHAWLRCKNFECFKSIFWQPSQQGRGILF